MGHMSVGPALVDRWDGFDYGLRMRCEECGDASAISAADYESENDNGAHMDCEHCGADIHFGPAVVALRDADDPALDDEQVSTFAWFHTSTFSTWPAEDYRDHLRPGFEALAERHRDAMGWLDRQASMALHLGTYEAAVENMLRRMHDQADAETPFYLYRVSVASGLRINVGHRDENQEEAAHITTDDLDRDGLDAVRYVNAWEAPGSLSLAVRPSVIRSVHRIALPVEDLVPPRGTEVQRLVVEWDAAREELDQARELLGKDPVDLRLRSLGLRADPGGAGRRAAALEHRWYELWEVVSAGLAHHLLPGVSPYVTRRFKEAMGGRGVRGSMTVGAFADRFAQHAALLTRSREVVMRLAALASR